MAKTVFKRYEKKYIMSSAKKDALMKLISDKITADEYEQSTVNSIYFDTDDYRLIRTSIEKPVYKEKLRLRSYTVPESHSQVFLELKKKYDGVVYKRRKMLDYEDARSYINERVMPDNSQIMREIDWTMHYYKALSPKMFIGYKRLAYVGADDASLRITFDYDIIYRTDNLTLADGSYGKNIIDKDRCIMEVKSPGAIPVWLCRAFDRLKIYPSSFSKYGTAYKAVMKFDINGGAKDA